MKQLLMNLKKGSLKQFLLKFKDKSFVQNILIEIFADLLMIAVGITIAYYIKTLF